MATKGRRGGDNGNPMIKAVPDIEIIEPEKKDAELYRQQIARARGVGGRPPRIATEQELIDKIIDYLDTIQDSDGRYNGVPSLCGLGAFLGYRSQQWHHGIPYQEVMDHFKLWLKGWRQSKIAVPRGGINPAGMMFLMGNRLDDETVETVRDVTPVQDDRPADVAAMIDDVWREKD